MQVAAAGRGLANSSCAGRAALTTAFARLTTPANAASLVSGIYSYGSNVSIFPSGAGEGELQDLQGNELPNAPKLTIAVGAQYAFDLGNSGWNATIRGDFYRQSSSYARYNNAFFDTIRQWNNINGSLIFARADDDLSIQLFVKNARNQEIVGTRSPTRTWAHAALRRSSIRVVRYRGDQGLLMANQGLTTIEQAGERLATHAKLRLSTALAFASIGLPMQAITIAVGVYLPRHYASHVGLDLAVVGSRFFSSA